MITHLFDECFFCCWSETRTQNDDLYDRVCHLDHLNLKVLKTKLRLGLFTSFSRFVKKFPVISQKVA